MTNRSERTKGELIIRDREGKIVARRRYDDNPRIYRIRNFRADLLAKTRNGEEITDRLASIIRGEPVEVTTSDGRVYTSVPTAAVVLEATIYAHQSLFGRPVPQTEVVEAAKEAEELQKYEQMSSEELIRQVVRSSRAEIVKALEAENAGVQNNNLHQPVGQSSETSEVDPAIALLAGRKND